MEISVNLPFEELLKIINKLAQKEKGEIAKLLIKESEISEKQCQEAIKRKKDFEEEKISSESWKSLKNRILN
jgi:hypothetical protein